MTKPRALRCAIYTRKSSEEGLEQDFNSLHAQRDACEAYVLSQAGEGWIALPTAYDDGGISGGTMERPGLKSLLADIAARKVDVVVVYKVDRLTRSLADFAKIVEVFDQNQVSFVSVTQSFNTTSSMGRLTLNMLLSFAQFEREVTSERIRDKIAASKRKGMWMGGNLPLGYDADGRTLKINEAEAETVRHIFRRYIELKSVHVLIDELRAHGTRSKRRQTRSGDWIGGEVFSRGALFHLLTNRTYLGLVPHKQEAYPGLHKPIVDQTLFDKVQETLAENRHRRGEGSQRKTVSSLTEKLFDAGGYRMTPTYTKRPNGRIYRYYVSSTAQQGRGGAAAQRISAPRVESAVSEAASRVFSCPDLTALKRAELRANELVLAFDPHKGRADRSRLAAEERLWEAEENIMLSLPVRKWSASRVEGPARRHVAIPSVLERSLRKAHATIARKQPFGVDGCPTPLDVYERRLAPLAFLAPAIQSRILSGWSGDGLDLTDPPMLWSDQERLWLQTGRQTRCEP